MYRTSRDTSLWLNLDNKGTWQDKDNNSKIATGMYQTSQTSQGHSPRNSLSIDMSRNSTKASSTTVGVLTDKQRKISWNKGTIPFGSGSARDLNPLKRFYVPGPDQYDVINV